ncbi:hypothetical protein [Thiorhodococcus minor]|uniref:hypothetical protein n=1 Tax=Thiorhodococcus minor TaxID=57489 RepID=UPI001FD73B91|nr:hypothetical protein [Thiorhodococcus minor]
MYRHQPIRRTLDGSGQRVTGATMAARHLAQVDRLGAGRRGDEGQTLGMSSKKGQHVHARNDSKTLPSFQ